MRKLKSGSYNSLRDTNSHDLSGLKVNALTVIEKSDYRAGSLIMWRCKCVCGRDDVYVRSSLLKSGKQKSCGCLTKSILSKARNVHGYSKSKNKIKKHTHVCWKSMRDRCNLESHKSYDSYGGAGIGYDERWDDFQNFVADMGDAPSIKHTVDRVDNSKGYFKENCRWATHKQQARNRKNNRIIEAFGEKKCVAEWAEEYGLLYSTLSYRLFKHGWDAERAITTPVRKKGSDQ